MILPNFTLQPTQPFTGFSDRASEDFYLGIESLLPQDMLARMRVEHRRGGGHARLTELDEHELALTR